ncbi:signal transduction histidine kinase [Stackebrandtia endophytica]|uniref:histidine kinase n=1 Tax=Stackebrandtia endophytica TaxID=1496996 RepID=A0A543AU15_9ACTN|nr:sensor histidine kinase [Stackebrandtia endophytica]TQL76015.1 signal transduction histidine kinase [Stackebrandtia endophytica]
MSKRSTTEASVAPPRRRLGLPRLADMRIRSKLGLILLLPITVLVGMAGIRLYESSSQALSSGDAAALVEFNALANELLFGLQAERAEAAIQINKDALDLDEELEAVDRFESAVSEADTMILNYRAGRGDLPIDTETPRFAQVLDNIDSALGRMGELRQLVREGDAKQGDLNEYGAIINWLLLINDHTVDVSTDLDLTRDLRVSGLVTEANENSERIRLTVYQMESGDEIGQAHYTQLLFLLLGREQALKELTETTTPEQNQTLNDSETGLGASSSRNANTFEAAILNATPDSRPPINHAELIDAYNDRTAVSYTFVRSVEADTVALAGEVRNQVVQQVLIEMSLVLITLIVAVLLALLIARSMAMSLRRLREGALDVAHVALPQAVASMRDSDGIGQRSPDEIVAELDDPLKMDNRDEIGTVAGAFNLVHREAIRTAAEQAALQSSVSQMFVNLARRSQNLVDRLIGHLDRLERGEEDPDRLAELFQLDHLATRMRRNDENLLVLAGADSTRVERTSAQIGDVLRAAQSEVEQYTRIEFGTVLADSEVEPGAINDIVHLIAELLDNATAFSPPDTAVIAEARQVGNDILVRITDRGIGMSPTQLNEINTQLADMPSVGISASRMMGLVVVGRLSHRHNLRVTLQEGPGRGTVAEVILPPQVLTGGAAPSTSGRMLDAAPPPPPPIDMPPYGGSRDSQRSSLFEPMDTSGAPQVEPFAPPQATNGSGGANGSELPRREREESGAMAGSTGVSFYPGDQADGGLPRRKIMEVTGEIVAEGAPDAGAVALPMIRLDAAPLPGPAPEFPSQPDGPPSWPAGAGDAPTADPVAQAAGRYPAMDETMELPIFREVESAWFKSSTPAPRPAVADSESVGYGEGGATIGQESSEAADSQGFAENNNSIVGSESGSSPDDLPTDQSPPTPKSAPEPGPSGLPRRQIGTPPEAPEVPEFDPVANRPESVAQDPRWRTAADQGWKVAAEKTALDPMESTEAGLPKRRPMERLVPGSVQEPAETMTRAPRRDPEGVRGLLSAYHRGVQRGRGNDR